MSSLITEMSSGEIIAKSIGIVVKRLPLFVLIETIVHLPVLAIKLLAPDFSVHQHFQTVVTLVPLFLLGPIGMAALIRIITQDYLGRPVSLGDALSVAMSRFASLLGTGLLGGLGIAVGLMLCFIPGIYLAIAWSVVNQVVVLEALSGPAALGRSKELVTGSFGQVFGFLFVVGLMVGVPTALISFGLNSAFPHLEIRPGFPVGLVDIRVIDYNNFAIVSVLTMLVTAVAQAFHATCVTLVYFDLRNRKESYNVDQIAAWSDQYRTWRDEPDAPFDAPPPATQGSTGITPVEPPARPPITEISENKPNPPPQ